MKMRMTSDMTKDQIKSLKAQIARQYPIEDQLKLFMEKSVGKAEDGVDLARRLRVARFLCDKADKILIEEMDVRGATEVLKALGEVASIRKDVDELLSAF